MQKTKGLRIVLYCLFPILFNVLFFMLGGKEHPLSVWISYAFIHIAWILLIATPFLTPTGAEKSIFNLSLYSISFFYLLAELILGIIIILIHPQTSRTAIILQILLLGIYAAVLIIISMANEHTASNSARHQNREDQIRDCCARMKNIADLNTDQTVDREIRRTYNSLHAAPVDESMNMNEIVDELEELETAVHNKDSEASIHSCRRIQKMLRDSR